MSRTAVGEAIKSVADSEPCGDGVPALHPAKHPGNGAQVAEIEPLTFCGATRRTRADADVFQFVDRRGLLEVFENVRILGDVGIWVMNGTTVTKTVDLGPVPQNWTIAGIGDFGAVHNPY